MDNWKNNDSEQDSNVQNSQSPADSCPPADNSADADFSDRKDVTSSSDETDYTNSSGFSSDGFGSRANSGSPYVDGFRPADSRRTSAHTPYNTYTAGFDYGSENASGYYRTPDTDSLPPVKKRRKTGTLIFIVIICVIVLLFIGGFAVYGLITSELGASLGLAHGSTGSASVGNNPIKPPATSIQSDSTTATTAFTPIDNAPSINIISAPVSTTTTQAVYEDGLKVLSIGEIAEKVTPSVVGIVTTQEMGTGLGSGIIMSEDGYILTNAHVVENGLSFQVILDNGEEFEASLIGADKKSDIAIIKIEATGLKAAEFGDSSAMKVGDLSVAIGNPSSLDLAGTTTAGIISAVDREIVVDSEGNKLRLIQTDAAINPGNSGGPLLNKYGQVIGINTVKMNSDTYEGLCFAIPTNVFKPIVDELFAYGCVHGHPSFGVSGRNLSYNQSRTFNVPMGFYIEFVNESSDAYTKGLQAGDIIVGINGQNVTTLSEINLVKNTFSVGDTVTLTVYRDGETLSFDIVLMDEADISN